MLKQTPCSKPKPASAPHDDIVERALQLIKPEPEQTEKARKRVARAIARIRLCGERPPRPAWTRQEYREFASALRTAIAALEHPLARDLFIVSDLTADRLREELAAVAAQAESEGSVRRGPKGKYNKYWAAFEAHELLLEHGVEPTLDKDGAFFQLAAKLYEGATDTATEPEGLSRACKRVVREFHRLLETIASAPGSGPSGVIGRTQAESALQALRQGDFMVVNRPGWSRIAPPV
jgi:hypothetical protein